VKALKTTGYHTVENGDNEIDYSLFKGLIDAMSWFYARMAMTLFLILSTVGTYYIHTILKTYSGSHTEVYIAWAALCIINSYSLYTLYYGSIMQGKGLIKRTKQIDVIGYSTYLVTAAILILCRFNLIAIVSAQILMVISRRILYYRVIYTSEFKQQLRTVKAEQVRKLLKLIYPNALKMGFHSIGRYFVIRAPLIIGSLYLPLYTIASYGITIQIIDIIWNVSFVYYNTYQPKIIQARAQDNNHIVKMFYLKSWWIQSFIFIIAGTVMIFLGDWSLALIKSKTFLLPTTFIIVTLFVFLLTLNYSIAEAFLSTKNEIFFYKASLLTGIVTIILLLFFLHYTNLGVWSLILSPGISQAVYSNWKWPIVVMKELKIKGLNLYENLYNTQLF
jgi:O-antigen/teichoic acid export membrane protein